MKSSYVQRCSLLLFFVLIAALGMSAQNRTSVALAPDCVRAFDFQATGRSIVFDNRDTDCVSWDIVYTSTGFSALSIEADFANDSGGQPGSWTIWPAAQIVSGTFPLTTTTSGALSFYGYNSWVSANLNSITGTGDIHGALIGWKSGPNQDATVPVPLDITGTQLSQALNNGAAIVENGGRWDVVSSPGAGTVASASKGAGAAGVRHVVDKVCFSGGATTAVAALTQRTIDIRDGATGAGTIVAQFDITIAATTGQLVAPFCTPSLNLIGTAATAMTAEFSGAVANLFESITITGYDVK